MKRWASIGWVVGLTCVGCLGDDTRPEPGRLVAMARGDEALTAPFTTSDGWTIEYTRFIASLGHVSPEGDGCVFYSDTAYNRVLDMRLPGSQNLSMLYALGPCTIDYEVSAPSADSVLGDGVTTSDRDYFRTAESDGRGSEAGGSLRIIGVARKNGVEKRFSWTYRDRVDYTDCRPAGVDPAKSGVLFESGVTKRVELVVRGGTPFQDSLIRADATLRFDAFAAADDVHGNGDGDVTLDELSEVPLSQVKASGGYADADKDWKTLGDYVYDGLFPLVVRYEGDGTCAEQDAYPNDRNPR